MVNQSTKFTLAPHHWYGFTMFPGYTEAPFHSPLRVDTLKPLGYRRLEIGALLLAYAAGVRDRTIRLIVLKRTADHLVCEPADNPGRTYVITPLTRSWMRQYFPNLEMHELFDPEGHPLGDSLIRAAN